MIINGYEIKPYANLYEANLYRADLRYSDLRRADLRYSNLRRADLRYSNLRRANLSGAIGLKSNLEMLKELFEEASEGFIVYKTFGAYHESPDHWTIEKDSIIEEEADLDRRETCSNGINFATLEWIKENIDNDLPIWKCLLRHEYIEKCCVPYATDGKARSNQLELLEIIKNENT